MSELHLPWLGLMVIIPLAGALLVDRLHRAETARKACLAFCVAALVCAIGAWQDFSLVGESVAHDRWDLLAWIAGSEMLVIDRLNAPLLPLTALLYALTTLATLRAKAPRFSFSWLLVREAIILATLSCRQPWGVIVLLAAGTLPPYLELRARGKPTRVYLWHMALFVLLMVVGWSLVEVLGRESNALLWAALPLTGAIMIHSGIAPCHCWVTDLFEHATFGTALLFVTPMLGAYAAIRLLLPIAPDAILRGLAIVSLATAVYAAGMALVQREARRFFCYIFLSHSALVLVGLDSISPLGLTGALCVWLSVGLSLTGFGLTLRGLEARHGRLSLAAYHGVYEHTPLLAVCFLLTGMASVGFPGTFGFIGTELLVDGAVQAFPSIGIAVVTAAALNGIAVMKAYFLLFAGTRHVSSVPLHSGMRERVAVLTLAALILGCGLWPAPSVVSRHAAAIAIIQQRRTTGAAPVHASSEAAERPRDLSHP